MADPNFAAVAEMVAFAANHFDEIEKYAVTATTGLVATQELLRNDLEGTWAQATRDAMTAQRARAAGLVAGTAVRAHVDPLLRQLMDAIDKPTSGDPGENWERLYDYMIANSQSVNSRAITYGSPSAGGGSVGTGTCIRVTLDEEGEPLEGVWPDAFTLTCTHDGNRLGYANEERFRLTGTAAAPDNLERDGTNLDTEVVVLCDRASRGIVTNPSFDDGSFSGATITTLNGWTATSALSNFETNTTSTYVWLDTTRGSGTARSLRIIANDTISQTLASNSRPALDRDVPYTICVAVYRRDSCDGTLTFTFGAVSRAVTMSGLSDNAWTLIHLVSTPGANNWYENLKANSFAISFQLASRTTGSLYLDGIVVAPMTRIGRHPRDTRRGRGSTGTYLSLIAGRTPFLMGDTFTFTDSESTRGVNQFWLGQIAGYGYLPSDNAAGETILDK